MTQVNLAPRIVSSQAQQSGEQGSEFTVPGIHVLDRYFACPLNHDRPEKATIQVFIRQCSRINRPTGEVDCAPRIVYLQGGPGFECSSSIPSDAGMLKFLLDRGFVVLFMDQRGTGMSTPISHETLQRLGSLDDQVQFCKNFRADSIVQDCEVIRTRLDIDSWSLLGQSFGGFCNLTYLSLFPRSLRSVISTGGMAPISETQPDSVYFRLAKKIIRRNQDYYLKFPGDVSRIRKIVAHLDSHPVLTPNGGKLSSRRFRQLGIELGMHGGFDRLHNIVLKLCSDLSQFQSLTYKARELVEHGLHYDSNPIYSILHEAIYCQDNSPSNWSAARVLSWFPEFQVTQDPNEPVFFYGETMFPWMFEDYIELRPLKDLAHRLAQEPWTPLYDLERLKINTVPIAATCYIEDMYVHIDLAIETLRAVGSTKDLVTNRYLHNGLRHAPEEILSYLFNLLSGDRP